MTSTQKLEPKTAAQPERRNLPPLQPQFDSLSSEVEAACRRFEAERESGKEARIEDYLAGHAEPQRRALLKELLRLELEERLRDADAEGQAELQKWLERFPDDAAIVREAFAAIQCPPTEAPDGEGTPRDAGGRLPPEIPGFRIERFIARGGMGDVWAAADLELGRDVAIKTLRAGNSDSARFSHEAKITAQLPHPGIPPVHRLGRLADGSPFLAMKLVDGRTLSALLRDRRSPADDLPRFVRIFEQIAQAVGFAHSRAIIHRDLKPDNVMVGAFGEALVMDWGLAKSLLAEAPGRPSDVGDIADGPSELTRAGTVMGTPGYMAPEQARGEPADARADVFALGSILAMILTGRPAFAVGDMPQIIEATAKGEVGPALARLAACGADAELIQLAKRCLAPAAADRPDDGRQVGEAVAAYRAGVDARLRQAETEKAAALVREAESRRRRQVWIGLAATLLIGLAAACGLAWWALQAEAATAKALADVTKERDEKEKARKAEESQKRIARENGALAKEAVVEFTQKVADHPRLKEKDFFAFRLSLLEPAINYFEKLVQRQGDDPDLAEECGRAHHRLALVKRTLGNPSGALKDFEAAERIFAELARRFPERREWLLLQACCRSGAGATKETLGDLHAAELDDAKALALFSQLAAGGSPSRAIRREQADCLSNFAIVQHRTGRRKEAIATLKQAVEALEASVSVDGADADCQFSLARCQSNLGVLLEREGNAAEAEGAYRAAVRHREALVALPTPKREHREGLAAALDNLGTLLADLSRLEEAEAALDRSRRLRQRLAEEFPSVPEHRSALATSHNNLAGVLARRGRISEAGAAYRSAVEEFGALAAEFSDSPRHAVEFAVALGQAANFHRDQGDLKSAAEAQRRALQILDRLAAQFPNEPERREDLAIYRNNFGNTLRDQGKLGEAKGEFEAALAHFARLRAAAPNTPSYELGYGNVCANLGHVAFDQGDRKASLAWAEQAIAALEGVQRVQPQDAKTRELLGRAYVGRAKAREAVLEMAGAQEDWDRGVEYSLHHERTGVELERAKFRLRWSQMILRGGDAVEAERLIRMTLSPLSTAAADPWMTFNAKSLLGAALAGQQKHAEAEPLLLAGYEGMKQRQNRIPPQSRFQVADSAERLVQLYDAWGKPAEAAKWRAELEALKKAQADAAISQPKPSAPAPSKPAPQKPAPQKPAPSKPAAEMPAADHEPSPLRIFLDFAPALR